MDGWEGQEGDEDAEERGGIIGRGVRQRGDECCEGRKGGEGRNMGRQDDGNKENGR